MGVICLAQKFVSYMPNVFTDSDINNMHNLNPSHSNRWVSKLARGLGLVKRVSRLFSGEYVQTLQSVVRRLTRNKDLQTVMCYAWGDFGTEPSKAAFLMMADLNNHFLKNGAFYPVL